MRSPSQWNLRTLTFGLLTCGAMLMFTGCGGVRGKPLQGSEIARPEEVLDFAALYGQNCAACHGEKGKNGAAISLANPVYLTIAGAMNIERVTANGVPGTAMPPFGKSVGGSLTERQIATLANVMVGTWGDPSRLTGQTPPRYANSSTGNTAPGEKVFATFCAQCHGTDGTGARANGVVTGTLVDPSYLALVSDQGLRSTILAGQTEQGPHDWRSYVNGHPMSDQEITDVVAWLASHRIATPGQVYKQHP